MATFTISGQKFELDRAWIEGCVADALPDPIYEHYVVVHGRRFPPKQVLACATRLDRADFTTHQARRILTRLGFVAARSRAAEEVAEAGGSGPYGGRQADALRPYVGQWVALSTPTEVLVAADNPQDVISWLAQHKKRASYGMFRVPRELAEAQGLAPS